MLFAMIFVAGVLHGLGPDHLAAITAFGAAVGHDFRRIVAFSTRFAGGHAVVLIIAGILGHFGKLALPLGWERGFDLAAGLLLVATGAAVMLGLATRRISLHAHEHVHHSREHKHVHLHYAGTQRHQHLHGKFAAALGALFALGGARSLLVVVPVTLANSLATSVLLIAAFVLGIALAMVAYAAVTQHGFRRLMSGRPDTAPVLRISSFLIGAFCVIAGAMTIYGRLRG